MNGRRTRPTPALYITGAVILVPTIATFVLAAMGSPVALGVGICSAAGWLVLGRAVRRGGYFH